jgi:UDP-glucose 4-epimerase
LYGSDSGIPLVAERQMNSVLDFHQTFANKKVLVTGGMGFIGSNLVRRLADLGAQVLLVDSMIPNTGSNRFNIAGIEDNIRLDNSDVRDEQAINGLVQGQDYLFNLAGQTSHMDSMEKPHIDLDINCRSQLSILEACRRHNPGIKLVFASTRQIYGKPDYLPVDERHLLRPVDVNGINKMAGEWYHILYNNVYGIRGCALRLTNTIGPRMRIKDARQTFLGIWVRLLLEGKPIEVWGGEQKRDYTYVDDAVDAFLLAAASEKANGQIYNLGGLGVWSLKETAELLVQANGAGEYKIKEFPADRKRIDIGDYYADYFGIHLNLGWAPRVTLQEAFVRTLAYYRESLKHYL